MDDLSRVKDKIQNLEKKNKELNAENKQLFERLNQQSNGTIESIEVKLLTEKPSEFDIKNLFQMDPCPFQYFHISTLVHLAKVAKDHWDVKKVLVKNFDKYPNVTRAFLLIEDYDTLHYQPQSIVKAMRLGGMMQKQIMNLVSYFSIETCQEIIQDIIEGKIHVDYVPNELYTTIRDNRHRECENMTPEDFHNLIINLARLHPWALSLTDHLTKEEAKLILQPVAPPNDKTCRGWLFGAPQYEKGFSPTFKFEPGSLEIILWREPRNLPHFTHLMTFTTALLIYKKDKTLFAEICPMRFGLMMDAYINGQLSAETVKQTHEILFEIGIIQMMPEHGTCLTNDEIDHFNKNIKA